MSESLLQAMKWYVLVFFTIIGTSAFIISDKSGSVKPIMVGIISYGIVYIMSYFWREFRRKILLYSILIFMALTIASAYVPMMAYLLLNVDPNWFDTYYTWAGTMLIGIPAMVFVFHKYD